MCLSRLQILRGAKDLIPSRSTSILDVASRPKQFRRRISTKSAAAAAAASPAAVNKASGGRPDVIFSGIQPTGIPHIGNYFGALKHWKDLQDSSPKDTKLLFCIVDLHSITVKRDPEELRLRKLQMAATFLAIGLDPRKSIIFVQSSIPAHSQLMWILTCCTPLGLLQRQTQWKDKVQRGLELSKNNPESNPHNMTGLLSYPILQAADILVYRSTKVPVGEDQVQHLELARNLASKMNKEFGDTFPLPEILLTTAPRVMSLRNPLSKMSKSEASDYSRINLTDSPESIKKKIGQAVTDSINGITYNVEERPGVSNLVELLGHMQGRTDYDALAMEYASLSMGEFKDVVQDSIVEGLKSFRENYERIWNEGDGYLREVMGEGALEAGIMAERTMESVKRRIGLSWLRDYHYL